jgi:hypothetical protein
MKKFFLATVALLFLLSISGFTVNQSATSAAKREDPGPAWINSDYGGLHFCYQDDFYVADGEPGDTYEWWLDPWPHGSPDIYLGTGTSVNIQLSYRDVLILKVNSIYYGPYDYYDTAWECNE